MSKVKYGYREEEETLNKLKYIAKIRKTSVNNILTEFVMNEIENYESENGEIDLLYAEIELKVGEESGEIKRIQNKNNK